MKNRILVLPLLVLMVACPSIARGDGDEEAEPVKIVLHPAAEPQPSLKYRLLPKFIDRIPGNAAVLYGKVTAEQSAVFNSKELWEKVVEWINTPLEELRDNQEARNSTDLQTIFYQLDRAARCEYCDWQLPIREEEFYTILLPEAQQTRSFARLLAARARVEIADGKYDEALGRVQSGFALARNVTRGQTLVNGLVGIAISSMMCDQLRDLIQQPDAPNVYWALTALPRPLIDLRGGLEAEMSAVQLSFPELRDVESARRTPEQWRQILLDFCMKVSRYSDRPQFSAQPEGVTLMGLAGYPLAKRALIEGGMDAAEVEAMPVAQVILLHTVRTYEQLRDDLCKWFYVSYAEGRQGIGAAEAQLCQPSRRWREIVPVASVFLPATMAVKTANVRNEREIAVLRVLEALRLHASHHDGKLPSALAEVTIVPVPDDPVTEEPFRYELRGDKARLEGPPLPGAPLRLEIEMRKQ